MTMALALVFVTIDIQIIYDQHNAFIRYFTAYSIDLPFPVSIGQSPPNISLRRNLEAICLALDQRKEEGPAAYPS